jgi:fructose-bisphosphate aldolase, class II
MTKYEHKEYRFFEPVGKPLNTSSAEGSNMPLVPSKALLLKAKRDGYAIGHFNICNMETVQAVIAAAEAKKSPVIIAVTESAIGYAGFEYLVSLVRLGASRAKVPVVLHLDHGRNMDVIKRCIENGFTSVMCDASTYDFEQNVILTKKVVQMAHRKGISVEGELGMITKRANGAPVAQDSNILTDPLEAKHYVQRTGIDSLAVSIGTSHGAYKFKGKCKLDLERLRLIAQKVKVPLVIHGASEIPAAIIKKGIRYGAKWHGANGVDHKSLRLACRHGINKVNIHTDISLVYMAATLEFLAKHPSEMDQRELLSFCRDEMKEFIMRKIEVLGSANRI